MNNCTKFGSIFIMNETYFKKKSKICMHILVFNILAFSLFSPQGNPVLTEIEAKRLSNNFALDRSLIKRKIFLTKRLYALSHFSVHEKRILTLTLTLSLSLSSCQGNWKTENCPFCQFHHFRQRLRKHVFGLL